MVWFIFIGALAIGALGRHAGSAPLAHFGDVAAAGGAVLILLSWLAAKPERRTGNFYVSAIDGYGQAVLVTGPYPTREAAESDVERVAGQAGRIDMTGIGLDRAAADYSWGVSESPDQHVGVANESLGFASR